MGKTIYVGSYVHSLSLTELQDVEHAVLAVGEQGTIEWIEHAPAEELQNILTKHGLGVEDVDVIELGSEEFLCPGMIDTHTVSYASPCGETLRRVVLHLQTARTSIPQYWSGARDTPSRLAGEDYLSD
jgi:cytosine/adenosine deaminase-related metal-dependent hydrolase